jgi:aminoglycoside phosphotransferase (APT) family kinase protein
MKLSRHEIPELTLAQLRRGEGTRPEVRLLEVDGQQVVHKDFMATAPLMRTAGRLLLSREVAAYERLAGLPGIPRCFGQPDPWSLLVEYIESIPAWDATPDLLTPRFYQRLHEVVAAMHRRAVAHGDLKRLNNIIVTPAGEPYLIDFASALWHGSNPLAPLALPHLFDDDLRAIYKLKARHTPDLLTPDEAAFLAYRSPVETIFRLVRDRVREPFQRLAGGSSV